jgi:hypothetical protein
LILRAHPTDERLDWGRITNNFIDDYRFVDGRLVDLGCERDKWSPGRWDADRGYFSYYYPDKDYDEFVRLGNICERLSDGYLVSKDCPDSESAREYREYCENPDAYLAKIAAKLAELPPDPGRPNPW